MVPKRKINYQDSQSGRQMWLTTFNDMVTLLMVFFVLLFSMGSLDVKRFKHFQNGLQSAMGILNAGRHVAIGLIADRQSNVHRTDDRVPETLPADEGVMALDTTQGLEAEYTAKGIRITLHDDLLFTSGSADITRSGRALLLRISSVIKPLKRRIRVEGHTDNVPIRTAHYPSNWELSTARAINVVKILIHDGEISPGDLSAVGYGDVKPKYDNTSQEARGKNRRVEIILGKVKETNTKSARDTSLMEGM